MKKYRLISLAFCLAALLVLTACKTKTAAPAEITATPMAETPEEATLPAQIGNPIVTFTTLEDAAASLKMDVPALPKFPEGYTQSRIEVIDNRLLQLVYVNSANQEITYRTQAGTASEDISGDYNVYETEQTVKIGDADVLTKGDSGKISVANWYLGNINYSLSFQDPVDEAALKAMISSPS